MGIQRTRVPAFMEFAIQQGRRTVKRQLPVWYDQGDVQGRMGSNLIWGLMEGFTHEVIFHLRLEE